MFNYSDLAILNSNNYLSINKKLAAYFDGNWSMAAFVSYLVGQALYYAENGQLTSDGFFYSCADKITAEISIKDSTQGNYLKILEKMGWIVREKRGQNGLRYIHLTKKMCREVRAFSCLVSPKIAKAVPQNLEKRSPKNCGSGSLKIADILTTNPISSKELSKEELVCEKSAGAKNTHTNFFSENSESEAKKSPVDASEEKRKKVAAKKEKFLQLVAEVAKQEEFSFLAQISGDTKKVIWDYFQTASDWEKTPTKVWVRNQFSKVYALVKDYSEKGVREEIARCQGSNFQQIAYADNKELQKYKREKPWQPTAAQTNNSPKNKPANESPTTAPKTDYKKNAEEHFSQTKKAAEPEQQILTSLEDLEKLAKENNINFETTDKGDLGLNAAKLARVLTISNFTGIASNLIKKAAKNDFLALCEKQKNNEYPIKAFIALLEFLANHHINRPDAI